MAAPTPVQQTTRLRAGDAIRVIATFAVVLQHVGHVSFHNPDRVSPFDWGLATVVVALTKWAVPVFVMLSGALLLEPRPSETLSAFYRKRFVRLGIPLLFFSAVYLAVKAAMFWDEPDRLATLPALLLQGRPFYHMFFLFVIVGLYAFTPMLRRFVEHSGPVELPLAIGLSLGIAAIGTGLGHDPNSAFTLFLPYIGYFLAGWWIRQHATGEAHRRLAWIGWIGASALLIGGSLWLGDPKGSTTKYLHHYQSLLLLAMSLGAFVLMLTPNRFGAPDGKFARLATRWSPLTLGVYLIHPLVLKILAVTTGITGASGPVALALPFVSVVAFAASFGITAILRRSRIGAALVGG